MERLKMMKENLMNCVQSQIAGNLQNVNAKELGEAVDMIKDLEEAIYYHTITKAMEEEDNKKKEQHQQYYYPMSDMYPYYRDMDRDYGRLFYDESYYDRNYYHKNGKDTSEYRINNDKYPIEMRDHREGRSPILRKSYMESKEMHKDTKEKIHELEKYMQELSQDIVEMIEDATPEEKQILQQKLATLSAKIK